MHPSSNMGLDTNGLGPEDGRSPADAGSGSQASPAADKSSAPSVSIPNAVHLVIRQEGVYETAEYPVRAFFTAREAEAFRRKAENEWAAAEADRLSYERVDYPADGAPDEEWEKWARKRKRENARFRRFLTCDKRAFPPGNEWSSPGSIGYFRWQVPLTASGIEAATADETRSGSAEGESPVGEAETPQTPSPSPSKQIEED